MKRIVFTVINDLTYDQRMQRICSALAEEGYDVLLIGRKVKKSIALKEEGYRQKRLSCFFEKGKLMYLEFNLRLLVRLLFTSADCYCAIDLDTILPVWFASWVKGRKRVYDAHELFTEQKEIVTRPAIHKAWLRVERFAVPRFKHNYTVNNFIAEELYNRYKVTYEVVRNLPKPSTYIPSAEQDPSFIIYQGAVNHGRSFETLIPAMQQVDARLEIFGDGNFMDEARKLIKKYKLQKKVVLKGLVPPGELKEITPKAYVAITLFEQTGLNQYHSLANRFFDYIMAGVPQVCVGYPQYEQINEQYEVAYLIYNTEVSSIANAINYLLSQKNYHARLQQNCIKARTELSWDNEKKVLLNFYKAILG